MAIRLTGEEFRMRPYVGVARVIRPRISARRHSKLAELLRNVALGMTEAQVAGEDFT